MALQVPRSLATKATRPALAALPTGADGPFASAATCRLCHFDIYQQWQYSRMTHAFDNPAFQLDYGRMQALGKHNTQAGTAACLRCHAPTAANAAAVGAAIGHEGVTCTVCHSVTRICGEENRLIMVMDPSGVRYGAHAIPPPAAPHPVGFSAALGASELCGTCHLDVVKSKAMGLMPLEWTYREWQSSVYAQQGVRCQDCHMPKEGGKAPHRFAGRHASSALLAGAAALRILPPDGAAFKVEVSNAKVGHNFPTRGAHPVELVLAVELLDAKDRRLFSQQRSFRLQYLNAKGKPAGLEEPVAALSDTTLKPLEKRVEIFRLPNPAVLKQARTMRASLTYLPVPVAMKTVLPPEEYQPNYRPVLIATAIAPLDPRP